MKEQLDQIQSLIKPETLTKRDDVLKVINTWATFKAALLAEVKKRPMGSFQQREELEDAIDRIKMMNIWPWGGALESILEHVKAPTILEHWARCVNFAGAELAKLEAKAA